MDIILSFSFLIIYFNYHTSTIPVNYFHTSLYYFFQLFLIFFIYIAVFIYMSFYSKGDFKIEESWGSNKPKDDKQSKSRNSQRKPPTNNNQSLMRQLADSLTEPTTDIIDDSLSKLLMKERDQHYGGIPKQRKQSQQIGSYKKTPQNNRKAQSTQDTDLVSSMANRLQKLQKTCQSQRLQIKEQKQTIEKIKTENAFLKGMKQDSGKTYEQMKILTKRNQQLEKKVVQMQSYLKQYGLKWVGNKVDGKLDDKAIKKDIADSKHPYRLPSQIDITTIRRRIADLNAGLQAEGAGTQIYSDKGVHKFRKAQSLPIGFYSNGIAVKGYNFYPYKSKQSLKILADLLDGYFPYIFKAKYPNGIFLEVVDHIEQAYVQQKKDEKITTLGTDKDFEPMSKQQFLNKLPNQIIKNGKVIPVRGEIQKLFTGKQQQKSGEQSTHVAQVDGMLQIKTPCWQKISEGKMQNGDSCVLKIRNEKGTIYIVKMFKNDKIIDIISELRKVVRIKFNLMVNFPKRIFNGEEVENLEQLGFYPNQNLHIQQIK